MPIEAAALTRVTNPDSTYTQFYLDVMSRRDSVTDANGNTVVYRYDSLGRMTGSVRLAGDDSLVTNYAYDWHDNLTEVADPDGNISTYMYDDRGRLTRDSAGATGAATYQYDAADNLILRIDSEGDSVGYGYNALNRLISIDYPGTTDDVQYVYDNQVDSNYCRGWLYQELSPSCTTTYAYTPFGEVARETRTIAGKTFTTRYLYTRTGDVQEIYYPSGLQVRYECDAAQRVKRVLWKKGRMEYRVLADSILGRSLSFDPVGNVTAMADSLDSLYSVLFAYDEADRLDSAASPAFPRGPVRYTHARNGNRVAMADDSGTTTYHYSRNRLDSLTGLGTRRFAYDARGNIIADIAGGGDSLNYQYDSEGRLTAVSGSASASYRYDSDWLRVYSQVGGTVRRFTYDNDGRLLGEYDSPTNWKANYVYLNGQPLAQFIPDEDPVIESLGGDMLLGEAGEPEPGDTILPPPPPVPIDAMVRIYYYHNDHLGTPQLLTDSTKAIRWKGRYEPYGGLFSEWVSQEQRLRRMGQMVDGETGRYYNWHRYYEPSLGRYLQPDPLGPALPGRNPYAYAEGNPLVFVDPDGRVPVLVIAWGVYEVGSSLWDLWEFLRTLDDPCATLGSRVVDASLLIASIVGPGGGYGALKRGAKTSLSKWQFRKNLMKMTGEDSGRKGYHAHHVFPRKHESNFAKIGIPNIHLPAFGAWWEAGSHRRNARAYNNAWAEFFDRPNATTQRAHDLARLLAKQYNLRIYF